MHTYVVVLATLDVSFVRFVWLLLHSCVEYDWRPIACCSQCSHFLIVEAVFFSLSLSELQQLLCSQHIYVAVQMFGISFMCTTVCIMARVFLFGLSTHCFFLSLALTLFLFLYFSRSLESNPTNYLGSAQWMWVVLLNMHRIY